MQTFRTSIPKIEFPFKFSHQTPSLCIGSCFAEHIGTKLSRSKIPTLVNPFGILYNPHSIANSLEYLMDAERVPSIRLIEANGLWHSFDHHGLFSRPEKLDLINAIRANHDTASHFLKNTKRLILTFGTSNAFKHNASNQIVANCHKIPNSEFDRIALSPSQIIDKISPLLQRLKSQNQDLEVLLTVSPIRHIRDGLIENQRSKARLLLAIEELCRTNAFVHYFPSYEIIMDDLRDYRFYKKDMIHPTEVAIDYIWEYFSQSFFDTKTKQLISKIDKIQAAVNHKPLKPDTDAHQKFLTNLLEQIDQLENVNNFLDFSKERKMIK